jgi:hypothetical protein
MATSMSSLLEEVSRNHFPHPPAMPEELEAFEQRVGWRLDPDLRAFYLHCNGAALIHWPDSPYELLPLSKIVRARVAICGEDDDRWGPASMYAFCYVRDGNYVVLDVSQQGDGRYPLMDGMMAPGILSARRTQPPEGSGSEEEDCARGTWASAPFTPESRWSSSALSNSYTSRPIAPF